MPTNYTLDLNTGLTQVLSDGMTDYLYSNGSIAQVNSTAEYFLGDALGSARQMTNASVGITYARGYDPYGVVTYTTGASHTEFGFTGEQYSVSTELLYLRARYYNSADGRFLTRDTWSGDVNRPLSLNRWMYVEGNPVNLTDPSGHISEGMQARRADLIVEKLKIYNVHVVKDWGYQPKPFYSLLPENIKSVYLTGCEWEEGNWRNARELEWTYNGVVKMAKKFGGIGGFWWEALKGRPIKFVRMSDDRHPSGAVAWTILDVKFYNDTFTDTRVFASGTVVHELAHVWDTRQLPVFKLSTNMAKETKSYKKICINENQPYHGCEYVYDPAGQIEAPLTDYGKQGIREDFADSFAICVYPSFKNAPPFSRYPIRKDYIEKLINGNRCS
ncbi:MAG: RHS repeat-associated core domain-containing protein [bacterium]|nr:RHS repeat-associated core domain-containing protein [bacterium]